MTLFILSILVLAAGPLLVPLLGKARWAARALDGFILVSIGGLVFVRIFPHCIHEAGGAAALAMVLGLLGPFLVERLGDPEHGAGRITAVAIGLFGLIMHALMDGVGLAAPEMGADGGNLLALTVVLHRLPSSMAVWWLVKPRLGTRGAVVALTVIAVSSTVGYIGSLAWVSLFSGHWWYVLQAFLIGALMHVIAHQSMGPAALNHKARWQPASAIGGLLAVVALMAISATQGMHDSHGDHGIGGQLISLALASAPPLLAAFLITAFLRALIPIRLVDWLRGGSSLTQSLKGTALGSALNICSCAVGPTYRTMIERGIPARAAIAFLVAAPEVGVASVLLSLRLLGVQIGLVRLGLAAGLGIAVGLIIGAAASRGSSDKADDATTARPIANTLKDRIREGFEAGFGEQVDHTLPWLLAGLGVAALIAPVIEGEALAQMPGWLQVLMLGALGAPLYVCATGSTPLVAVLVQHGLTPGAAIAFLLIGQVTNIATFKLLAGMHERRVAAMFSLGIGCVAVTLGWITNLALGDRFEIPSMAPQHGAWAVVEAVSLAVLAALVLVSLFRQGVAGFVSQVLSLHGHDHVHLTDHVHHHHDHHHPDHHH